MQLDHIVVLELWVYDTLFVGKVNANIVLQLLLLDLLLYYLLRQLNRTLRSESRMSIRPVGIKPWNFKGCKALRYYHVLVEHYCASSKKLLASIKCSIEGSIALSTHLLRPLFSLSWLTYISTFLVCGQGNDRWREVSCVDGPHLLVLLDDAVLARIKLNLDLVQLLGDTILLSIELKLNLKERREQG